MILQDHFQITARYNFERLFNNLARVRPFNIFHDPIPEGYFTKLGSTVASRSMPARAYGSVLRDMIGEMDTNDSDVISFSC